MSVKLKHMSPYFVPRCLSCSLHHIFVHTHAHSHCALLFTWFNLIIFFWGKYVRLGYETKSLRSCMRKQYRRTYYVIRDGTESILEKVMSVVLRQPVHFILFVSHLRPMGFNVLGYQSHLLQGCHSACGHEGSSHLSPVLAL